MDRVLLDEKGNWRPSSPVGTRHLRPGTRLLCAKNALPMRVPLFFTSILFFLSFFILLLYFLFEFLLPLGFFYSAWLYTPMKTGSECGLLLAKLMCIYVCVIVLKCASEWTFCGGERFHRVSTLLWHLSNFDNLTDGSLAHTVVCEYVCWLVGGPVIGLVIHRRIRGKPWLRNTYFFPTILTIPPPPFFFNAFRWI